VPPTDEPAAPVSPPTPPPREVPPRVIAEHRGETPGPLTIFVAGIHGNEPRGVEAVQRVFRDLAAAGPPFRGSAVAILGNAAAYARGRRFIDSDLNRAFAFDLVEDPAVAGAYTPRLRRLEGAEAIEREAVLEVIRERVDALPDGTDAIVIDLHTFSGDGPPFCVFADTLRNRDFAAAWPLPRILGLPEEVPGTLAEYVTDAGLIGVVVETGRHDDPRSALLHEAVVRRALVHAGHLAEADVPGGAGDRALLDEAVHGLPPQLDVQYRHPVRPEDGFRMRPGWANFDPLSRQELVADDAAGPVASPRRGRMLLPLYQEQGSDGFFVARPIGGIWLAISRVLRRLGVAGVATLLPGVRRHERRPLALVVDRRIARWLAVDVFHLLGFRRVAFDRRRIVVARRLHDRRPPRRIRL
jgi:succinylglutamate desuccinylase